MEFESVKPANGALSSFCYPFENFVLMDPSIMAHTDVREVYEIDPLRFCQTAHFHK